jgi:DNA-binding NarL/FixJ family response regulator
MPPARPATTGVPFHSASDTRQAQARTSWSIRSRLGELTQREHEAAALVANGLTNAQIAGALVIGERTVETHISHILSKLGVQSRTHLAVWVTKEAAHADVS